LQRRPLRLHPVRRRLAQFAGLFGPINAWNTEKRYIRAYTTSSGQYWAEYDIDVSPGGTYEQLDHTLTRWRSIIGEYKTYMGF
jgi:hypothetical protein